MKRSDNVRQEGYLMEKFITAHQRGDNKKRDDIAKHFQRNAQQIKQVGKTG